MNSQEHFDTEGLAVPQELLNLSKSVLLPTINTTGVIEQEEQAEIAPMPAGPVGEPTLRLAD
jgi:hypothetical protein